RPAGSTHDSTSRARISSHKPISRNRRKLTRNAPTTASLGGLGAGSEDRPADPNDRRALLDGDRVIVAHAHRQSRSETWMHGPKLLGEPAECDEGRARELRRRDEPADRHEPVDPDPGQLEDRRNVALEVARLEPGLRRVVVDIDLE